MIMIISSKKALAFINIFRVIMITVIHTNSNDQEYRVHPFDMLKRIYFVASCVLMLMIGTATWVPPIFSR